MKLKPDASWNADSTERRVRKSLSRAGVQLGYAVTGALTSSLEALEERLESGPASGGTAQNRMRELLNRDRAMLHTRRGRPAAAPGSDEYGFAGKPSGGTARGRMRELLSQDRAMLSTLDEEPFSELFEPSEQSGTVSLPAPTVPRAAAPVAPPPAGFAPPQPEAAAPAVAVMRAPVMVGEGTSTSLGRDAPQVAVSVFDPVASQPVVDALAPAQPVPAAAPAFVVFAPTAEVAPSVAAQSPAVVEAVAPPSPAAPAKKAMPSLPNKAPVGSAPVAAPLGEDADSPIRTRSMARLLALQGYRDKALSIYDDLVAAEPDNAELRAEADRLRS